MRIDKDNVQITGFYRYPTYPKDVLYNYDDFWHKGRGNACAKELYEKLIVEANELYCGRLNDNKTAIEFIYKPTNTRLFVCNKDNVYSISLSVRPEFDNLYIDLTKKENENSNK